MPQGEEPSARDADPERKEAQDRSRALTESEAAEAGRLVGRARTAARKRGGFGRRGPLPLSRRGADAATRRGRGVSRGLPESTSGRPSDPVLRRAIERDVARFEALPTGSRFAQHRLRVLRAALEVLDAPAQDRTAAELESLKSLLDSLSI